jgi:hypothetical protein
MTQLFPARGHPNGSSSVPHFEMRNGESFFQHVGIQGEARRSRITVSTVTICVQLEVILAAEVHRYRSS